MTEIEVKDLGHRICLTIWSGSWRGNRMGSIILLTPGQHKQLIKALRHPIPYQPKQQHGQDH